MVGLLCPQEIFLMPEQPATRSQMERLAWLRDALRAGGANARQLAERFEVNERTIRRDVKITR